VKEGMDRRRAIGRLVRAGAAVAAACAIPVMPRSRRRPTRLRLAGTRIGIRVVDLGEVGPAEHLAG
jgi:hypothetical protein